MDGYDLARSANDIGTSERRNPLQDPQRLIGRLVSCSGSTAVVSMPVVSIGRATSDFWSIGRLITLEHENKRIIGIVFEMNTVQAGWTEGQQNIVNFNVELAGEVMDNAEGNPVFSRGVTAYPMIGALAHRVRAADLAAIYSIAGECAVTIGNLSQDSNISAVVNVHDMLSKHFAVVGSTGVGKTTAVTLLIRKAIEAKPNLRVLIFDPHNEYELAFNDDSTALGADNLDLPFWMFNFEELSEVVFRGSEASEGETTALMEIISTAKTRYQTARSSSVARRVTSDDVGGGMNVDSPVPYRMADVFQIILDLMGKLDPRHSRADLRLLKGRLEALCNNYRYRFMFRNTMIEDNIEKVIGNIFRIPHRNRRIIVLQMADLPSDVTNSVVSVLSRLALDLAVMSHGGFEISVICEEAHRYIPLDPTRGFGPTRQAISRIAKEGRKFGASIGVISQRPSELDTTIISQCSTVFAMRLSNENDKAIIRAAISQSSESRIGFLSSLRDREAIAFGEAIATPMRMFFETIPMQNNNKAQRSKASETIMLNQETDLKQVVMRGLDDTQRFIEDAPPLVQPATTVNTGLRSSLYRTDFKDPQPRN